MPALGWAKEEDTHRKEGAVWREGRESITTLGIESTHCSGGGGGGGGDSVLFSLTSPLFPKGWGRGGELIVGLQSPLPHPTHPAHSPSNNVVFI